MRETRSVRQRSKRRYPLATGLQTQGYVGRSERMGLGAGDAATGAAYPRGWVRACTCLRRPDERWV